jgi:hypothetical protein
MRGLCYLSAVAIAIFSVLIFEAGSVHKHANGQEQCNNQTGNNCARSRLPLPLPFDDGSVESAAEEEQVDDENSDKDFDSGSENELPLPLPFP